MNRNEIIIATQSLSAELDNLLVTDSEFLCRLNELLEHAQVMEMDDQLKHELIMVRSLMSLKRNNLALLRLQKGIVATFFRFPPPKLNQRGSPI
ncbi:hypothetical protein [Caballeronia sp. LZ001]|uniref:hypothetical protein n=1 Tax=Caballeronia sp. LZ001 TaxID=3038553 RepID=UPI00286019B5|nr:hypothetical protein [Caballeronia sp. LZ001]MDR5806466.1 hypothetical protein [Caballeronia sp. LZ001]